jgi:hypothetical protein
MQAGMKTNLGWLVMGAAALAVVGCTDRTAERAREMQRAAGDQADAIRKEADAKADQIRAQADSTRQQAEKQADVVENRKEVDARADQIRAQADGMKAQAEQHADAVENQGERRADALEKTADQKADMIKRSDRTDRDVPRQGAGMVARVDDAQEKLKDLGFYHGTVDGRMGPQTRAALGRFQEREGIDRTQELDNETWEHLNRNSG